jgi:hypothetical protein
MDVLKYIKHANHIFAQQQWRFGFQSLGLLSAVLFFVGPEKRNETLEPWNPGTLEAAVGLWSWVNFHPLKVLPSWDSYPVHCGMARLMSSWFRPQCPDMSPILKAEPWKSSNVTWPGLPGYLDKMKMGEYTLPNRFKEMELPMARMDFRKDSGAWSSQGCFNSRNGSTTGRDIPLRSEEKWWGTHQYIWGFP